MTTLIKLLPDKTPFKAQNSEQELTISQHNTQPEDVFLHWLLPIPNCCTIRKAFPNKKIYSKIQT